MAARKDRRLKRHLEKLEHQYDDYTDQTDAAALPEETAGVKEAYDENESIRHIAAEPRPQQMFPLIALAAAAFAAGVILGYELGRAGSKSSFDTPNQPIPAVLSTSSQAPREEQGMSSISPLMPGLDQAISQASEKQELRLHARTAAAAIESSSEADPRLFASAAGLQVARVLPQLTHNEQLVATVERPSPPSESRGTEDGNNASQPQTSRKSHPLPFPDTTVLASSRSPGNSRTPHDREEIDAHHGEPGVVEALEDSCAASAHIETSAGAGADIPAALKASTCSSDAHPGCIEAALDSDQQASNSGREGPSNMSWEPDMLQSMQWVASSNNIGKALGHQPEHWDRATAFWTAFTGKLDVSPSAKTQYKPARGHFKGSIMQAAAADAPDCQSQELPCRCFGPCQGRDDHIPSSALLRPGRCAMWADR